MKAQSYRPRNLLMLFFFVLMYAIIATSALAAPARVAILPFDVHAEKDLTFLQEGILDMLSSRLAWRDKVEVINENQTKAALASTEDFEGESRALLVGGKLQADYVLFGSLTVFGESVSIDARMVDVSGQQAPLPFFAQTRGMGEVIPKINEFATNINATVFGRAVAQRPVAAPAPPVGVSPATPVQPAPQAYDPRMHPEKLLQSGIQSKNQVQVAGQPYQTPNPAFVAVAPSAATHQTSGPEFWKSRNYNKRFNDVAVADVDQDGLNEVVVAEDDTVTIYRMINAVLTQVAEIKLNPTAHILNVSIGDVNGNQIPEIFVSGLNKGMNRAVSAVYEYNQTDFTPLVEKYPYYFNAQKTAYGEVHLFGQKQLTGSSDVHTSPIHEMVWDGGQYRPANRILKGEKANVLSIAYERLTPGDPYMVLVFDNYDRIRIYNRNGDERWRGSKRYGGSQKYFLSARADNMQMENRKYYPLPLKAVDLDNDGRTEFIAVENFGLTRGRTQNFRKLTDAKIESLSWDGLGLATTWETKKTSGHISGFDVGDFNNNGSMDIVAVVVMKDGSSVLSNPLSSIIAYEINLPENKKK